MENKIISHHHLKKWFGLGLIAASFALYGGLVLVPFVSLSAGNKVLLSSLLVICGEASFWIGILILGKEAASKYRNIKWRSWVAGWLRPQKKSDPKEEAVLETNVAEEKL